jgi:DNA-directed RNA polymerase subunit RPC12/RpoP
MTVYQIACDNCGAKYKLPETFQGKQAKCQKCGSVIEVQKQREAASAAAAAPAAKPAAAARPAVDRSKPAAAEAGKPAAARPARAGKADDGADGGKKARGERETKKANTMPITLAAVGLLAVAGAAFFLVGGKDKPAETPKPAEPAKQEQAKAEAPKAEAPKPEAPKAEAPKGDAPKAEAPAATPPTGEPAKAEPPAAAATPAVPEDPTRPKKPWERMRNAPASIAEVADPKSYGDVPWPPGIDDAAKGKLRELAAEAAGDGIRSTRAKNELQKAGWPAIFALVEQLQKLDYKQAEPSMVGFDLNKLLETITGGVNLRYEPVDAGESIPAAKAEWNTRTVKGWIEFAGRSVDQEAYDKARAERLKKAGGADK